MNPKSVAIAGYVQYGCGWTAPPEWTNFDASPTLRWEKIPLLGRYTKNSERFPHHVLFGDIIKGLPIADESCNGVFASHVLEHLTLEEFHIALRNTHRLLRKGGIFRLIVPDLERSARNYLALLDQGNTSANSAFIGTEMLGRERRQPGLKGLVWELFNVSYHLWMWDELSLTKALKDHGFEHIRRCSFGDAEDPAFSFVERRDRFENALAMEARR